MFDSDFLARYRAHFVDRAVSPYAIQRSDQGIAPKPIEDQELAEAIVAFLSGEPTDESQFWFEALENNVAPATPAANVKAAFLKEVALGLSVFGYTTETAIESLGRMVGGSAFDALVDFLSADSSVAELAVEQLKGMIFVYDGWQRVFELSKNCNPYAQSVIHSWALAGWFVKGTKMPKTIRAVVYRITAGNTEPHSPASEAHTRADLWMHSLAWLSKVLPNAIKEILALKAENPGVPVLLTFTEKAFGGSSRATGPWNAIRWIGEMTQGIPGFWRGGLMAAPVFDGKGKNALLGTNTLALTIGKDWQNLHTGEIVDINTDEGTIVNAETRAILAQFSETKNGKLVVIPDEERTYYQGNGSVNFLAGRILTDKVREALSLPAYDWGLPGLVESHNGKYTAVQKVLGIQAGAEGVAPGSVGLFKVELVASQETTGTITRLAMNFFLACVRFLTVGFQSVCHTAAVPKGMDVENWETLPSYFKGRGGIGLKRGDGVIHTWLKKMSAPGWLIIGGDSHTRNVFGVAFPADSLLVAFAAAFGLFPYTVPESIRIEFKGDWTRFAPRDLQLMLIEKLIELGLVDRTDTNNVLNGKAVEIYGLDAMPSEQKFEIMNAMGEYGPVAQWIYTPLALAIEEVRGFVDFWKGLLGTERGDEGINRLVAKMEEWLANPVNPVEDEGAQYAHRVEIDLDSSDVEPLVTMPGLTESGDLGDSYLNVARLSEVLEMVPPEQREVEEAAILSCTARKEHFVDSVCLVLAYIEKYGQVGGDRLWYSPPAIQIDLELRQMGLVDKLREAVESIGLVFWDNSKDAFDARFAANFRWEIPGCSLCMGNQEKISLAEAIRIYGVKTVRKIRVIWGSFTRNNKGRLGNGGEILAFMADPLLATMAFLLRKAPSLVEYNELKELVADYKMRNNIA